MRLFLIGSLSLLVLACSTSSKSNDQEPATEIYFGSGGGMSGMVTEYLLRENGDMLKVDPLSGTPEAVKEIRKRKARKIFQTLDSLNPCLRGEEFPDNYYFFIKTRENGKECGWMWGNRDAGQIDEQVISLYKELTRFLKTE